MSQEPLRPRGGAEDIEFFSNLLAPKAMAFGKMISTIVIVITGWFAVTLEVFARYEFGERYLGVVRLLLALGAMLSFSSLVTFVLLMTGPSSFSYSRPDAFYVIARSSVSPFFVIAYVVLGVRHLVRIWSRNWDGIQWHSMSFGIPRLGDVLAYFGFMVDDWNIYRFFEPFVFFILGAVIYANDLVTGLWIMTASVCLFAKNNMVYAEMRNRMLDMIDARIESEYMSEAVSQRPQQETHGFSVIPEMSKLNRRLRGLPEEAEPVEYSEPFTVSPQGLLRPLGRAGRLLSRALTLVFGVAVVGARTVKTRIDTPKPAEPAAPRPPTPDDLSATVNSVMQSPVSTNPPDDSSVNSEDKSSDTEK